MRKFKQFKILYQNLRKNPIVVRSKIVTIILITARKKYILFPFGWKPIFSRFKRTCNVIAVQVLIFNIFIEHRMNNESKLNGRNHCPNLI
jgi:hypothetical protein